MATEVRSDQILKAELPRTKQAARELMKRRGIKGLAIKDLEANAGEMRAFCLTSPRLTLRADGANAMDRHPATVVFRPDGDDVAVERADGWVVYREWRASA